MYSQKCSECESDRIIELRSEGCVVCAKCGLVLNESIYDEHESFYSNTDGGVSMLRHGAPIDPLLEQSSLSTMMAFSHRFKRVKQIHDRLSMNYTERALYHAFASMTRIMEDKLSLSKGVIETAKAMYKDLKEKRISRGQIHKALTAACVYYACKLHGSDVVLTKNEIALAFDVNTTKLNKACKIFRDLTKDKPYFFQMFGEIQISEIIERMTHKLNWKSSIDQWNVIKVIRAMDDVIQYYGNLDNKHINSVLAALIYIAANDFDIKIYSPVTKKLGKVTKSIVCTVYDLTLITLNKTIKEVQRVIEQHTNKPLTAMMQGLCITARDVSEKLGKDNASCDVTVVAGA